MACPRLSTGTTWWIGPALCASPVRFGNADARLRQRSRMSPSEKPREEGKDLSVKLFIVVVAVLLVVASMAAADGRAYTHGGPGLTTRPCGYLSVGKGWASSRDAKRRVRLRPQAGPQLFLGSPLPCSPAPSGHCVHRQRLPLHRAGAAGRRGSRTLREGRAPGSSLVESLTELSRILMGWRVALGLGQRPPLVRSRAPRSAPRDAAASGPFKETGTKNLTRHTTADS